MAETDTYVSGGHLGDLFHQLYVIHGVWKHTGRKGILYITDDTSIRGVFPFANGNPAKNAVHTHKALAPLVMAQEYIASFHVYQRGDPPLPPFVNLNSWRWSPLFYKTHWLHLLQDEYRLASAANHAWIVQPADLVPMPQLHDKIVIHRSYLVPHRINPQFPIRDVIKLNPGRCVFASTDPEEYNHFACKAEVPFLHLQDLSAMMAAIASCAFFVGNQSAPLALAWAMQKPCLAELNARDAIMYKHPDVMWYLSPTDHNLKDLQKWIRIKVHAIIL